MKLKIILENNLKYPPKIIARKAIYKGFTLIQDYIKYFNVVLFRTKSSDNNLCKKF